MKKENITIDVAGYFDEHDAKSIIALLKKNGVKANMDVVRPDIVEDEFQEYNAVLEDVENEAGGFWGQNETPASVKTDLKRMDKQIVKFQKLIGQLQDRRQEIERAFEKHQEAQTKKK